MSIKTVQSIRRVMEIFKASKGQLRPHFILTGPSGAGKSHTVQMLSDVLDIPMFEVNAASLTKEGVSGNSLSKALTPMLQMAGRPVICFVDEFDKLFISGNNNDSLAHESTNGVQNEFLKVIEGHASVFGDYGKYINVKTDMVLFVFAGAFNGEENMDLDRLRSLGLKTEFLGRVGLTFGMEKVSIDTMLDILNNSPLLTKYLALFRDVQRETVIGAIGAELMAAHDNNTLGVRLINTLIHQYFILGGLPKKEAQKVSFQTTLTFSPTQH